jgi:hypothetical protein
MFGNFVLDFLFFAVPVALLVLFGVCIYRYVHAKKENEKYPGLYTPEELHKRKGMMIITGCAAAAPVIVTIGFLVLIFMAVAYM